MLSRSFSTASGPPMTLKLKLKSLHLQPFPALQSLDPIYEYPVFTLRLDKIQKDPFAPASKISLIMNHSKSKIPKSLLSNRIRRIALADYLLRRARDCFVQEKSIFLVDHPSQNVIERSSCVVTDEDFTLRFYYKFRGFGRKIDGIDSAKHFGEKLPKLVEKFLMFQNMDRHIVQAHVDSIEDQATLRKMLDSKGLVAFVKNGAVLPRKSGDTDVPMRTPSVIPFESPPSLEVSFDLPHSGRIVGMGIPKGVTLIAGGGFHGKSTLLQALQFAIYNQIPGDGREFVVIDENAVKIRAEDGRCISSTNISPFIQNLPLGQNTIDFSTLNASGSTSMAANIQESLQAGARCLLFDEDTCATNFMIRDARMQALISKDNEPIIPLVSKIRSLYEEKGCSSIMVIGGCGDYLDVSDLVVSMENYLPKDLTEKAREISKKYPSAVQQISHYDVHASGVERSMILNIGQMKIKNDGMETIQFGRDQVYIRYIEQLIEPQQAKLIAHLIQRASDESKGEKVSVKEFAKLMEERLFSLEIEKLTKGLYTNHGLAMPRAMELIMSLNRIRNAELAHFKQ